MWYKSSYYEDLYNNLEFNIVELGYAPRGRIMDANGKILVDNKGVKVLVYNKLCGNTISDELEISNILGDFIDLDTDSVKEIDIREYYYLSNKDLINNRVDLDIKDKYLNRKITSDEYLEYKYSLVSNEEINSVNIVAVLIYKLMNSGYYYEDKILLSNISEDLLIKINELNLNGIRCDMTYERVYNYDTVLNQLFGEIGFIQEEKKEYYLNNGYELNDIVGVSFLEEYYEEYLRGSKAKYKISDNKLVKISDSVKGNDIVLGIDIDIQIGIENVLKEQILNAKKFSSSKYYNGSYIVLSDSDTGLIKALVGINYQGGEFKSDVIGVLKNSYTVGSVVKGASSYVAYEEGVLDEGTRITDSCVKLKNQLEKCSHKSLGSLNDINALAYSSNYFQFINVINVTGDKYTRNMVFNPGERYFDIYREYFSLFGLGTGTGIDISGEVTGIKGSKVSGDLLLNYVIGQYDTYTPLQLNQYVSTIANNGYRYKLRIGDILIDNNGNSSVLNTSEVLNRVNDTYLDRIRMGFNASVKYGTGVNYFNYKLGGGKTGTSETYINNKKTTTKSFVGYYNINDTNYAISIISPNIGYENSVSDYVYPINSRLSRQIADILFEN